MRDWERFDLDFEERKQRQGVVWKEHACVGDVGVILRLHFWTRRKMELLGRKVTVWEVKELKHWFVGLERGGQ